MVHEITHYLTTGKICEVVVRSDVNISAGDDIKIKNFEHSKKPVFAATVNEIIERRPAAGGYTIPHDYIKLSTN